MTSIWLLALLLSGSATGVMSETVKARTIEQIKKGMEASEFAVQKVSIYQNSGKTVFEIVHCPQADQEDAFLGTAVAVIDKATSKLIEASRNALIVSCGLDDFWVVALQDLARTRALATPEERARALREQQLVFTNKERKALAETLSAELGKGGLPVAKVEVVHRTDCVILVLQLCLKETEEEKLGALAALLAGVPALTGKAFASAEINIQCGKDHFYNIDLSCLVKAKDLTPDAEKLSYLKKRCNLKKMKYKLR